MQNNTVDFYVNSCGLQTGKMVQVYVVGNKSLGISDACIEMTCGGVCSPKSSLQTIQNCTNHTQCVVLLQTGAKSPQKYYI